MAARSLTDLPPELLSKLFSYIPGEHLVTVAQTCKIFNAAVNIESVWRERCYQEYRVTEVDTTKISYRTTFTKLLYPWGYTLGVWRADISHYGGLLHIQFKGHTIQCTQYLAPPYPGITKPLRSRSIFTVTYDKTEDRGVCHCNRGAEDRQHPAQLFKVDSKETRFKIKCSSPDLHMHPEGRQNEFLAWYNEEIGSELIDIETLSQDFREYYLMKFMVLLQYESSLNFMSLKLPQPPYQNVPMQPGLFKGTYSVHGVEIVLLDFDLQKNEAFVTKITGDPNVPAGEFTIKADMNRAMILNSEQQASISMLAEIDTADVPPGKTMNKLPIQPFEVPPDCLDRVKPPRTCTFRCHSQGQIAGHGYSSPKFISGHWIVFDEDTFGHIWFQLESLLLFSRVKEDLSH